MLVCIEYCDDEEEIRREKESKEEWNWKDFSEDSRREQMGVNFDSFICFFSSFVKVLSMRLLEKLFTTRS